MLLKLVLGTPEFPASQQADREAARTPSNSRNGVATPLSKNFSTMDITNWRRGNSQFRKPVALISFESGVSSSPTPKRPGLNRDPIVISDIEDGGHTFSPISWSDHLMFFSS